METPLKIKRMIVLQISGNTVTSLSLPGNPTIKHGGGRPTVHSIVVEKDKVDEIRSMIESSGLSVEIYHPNSEPSRFDLEEIVSNMKYVECVECSLSSSDGRCLVENPDIMTSDLMKIDGSVRSINRCPIYGKDQRYVLVDE